MSIERKEEIRFLLQEHGNLTVSELAKKFSVSEMTIRRDLKTLAAQGLIQREHGRALYPQNPSPDTLFFIRLGEAEREKTLIGRTAAAMVNDGDTIILDAGTTTLAIAQSLSKKCVVITNSLPIASVLENKPDITVFVTGGEVRGTTYALVGPMTTNSLRGFNADKLFLGSTGVSIDKGLTTTNIHESEVKQAMITRTKDVILVAHSDKFGKVFYHTFANLDKIHTLITDSNIGQQFIEAVESYRINVITAS